MLEPEICGLLVIFILAMLIFDCKKISISIIFIALVLILKYNSDNGTKMIDDSKISSFVAKSLSNETKNEQTTNPRYNNETKNKETKNPRYQTKNKSTKEETTNQEKAVNNVATNFNTYSAYENYTEEAMQKRLDERLFYKSPQHQTSKSRARLLNTMYQDLEKENKKGDPFLRKNKTDDCQPSRGRTPNNRIFNEW